MSFSIPAQYLDLWLEDSSLIGREAIIWVNNPYATHPMAKVYKLKSGLLMEIRKPNYGSLDEYYDDGVFIIKVLCQNGEFLKTDISPPTPQYSRFLEII